MGSQRVWEAQEQEPKSWIKKKSEFLLLLMGLLAVISCVLVPGVWLKGLTLIVWLVLFGTYWWRRKCSDEKEGKLDQENSDELQRQQEKERVHVLEQECQRLMWQLDHLKQEIREKETIRDNLRENIEEIQQESHNSCYPDEELEAVKLAVSSIKEVSRELYQRSSDELNRRVSEILCTITEGRYTSIFLDEALRVRINTPNKLLSIEQVSRGTMDQIYFALRMAAGELLCKGEPMPIILDDAFAMYDEKRLRQTLKWLIGTGRQVLLLTCHKREQEIYEEILRAEER